MFEGMDPEAVRAFASQLSNDAEQIDNIINSLTGQLHGVQWVGADAARFRGEWDGTYRPQLHSVSNALRDAANVANSNAAQQEQASAN
ncbi:WXG100 family type VII secretion target [Actinospica sp. MGRD01-02]|uniref:WXG100 family type VII secretion target n=1 Tax=Actinospica acidithermotolerans TaxID=2828514 RepID=A0A941IKY0_9ACTN|nr:WXG100 family type VII secretion target [Actinospica acidithermotolerans]MBR7828538.1 WXG100 family type VII secretion target [Actinospica acidithermotolerans]